MFEVNRHKFLSRVGVIISVPGVMFTVFEGTNRERKQIALRENACACVLV